MYMIFKHIHMLMAVVSVLGFIIRGGLRFSNSPILDKKLIQTLPHVVDSLLLLSAIVLTVEPERATGLPAWMGATMIGRIAANVFGLVVLLSDNNHR